MIKNKRKTMSKLALSAMMLSSVAVVSMAGPTDDRTIDRIGERETVDGTPFYETIRFNNHSSVPQHLRGTYFDRTNIVHPNPNISAITGTFTWYERRGNNPNYDYLNPSRARDLKDHTQNPFSRALFGREQGTSHPLGEWRTRGFSSAGMAVSNPFFPDDVRGSTDFHNRNFLHADSSRAQNHLRSFLGTSVGRFERHEILQFIEEHFLPSYPNFASVGNAEYWADRLIPMTDPRTEIGIFTGVHEIRGTLYYVSFITNPPVEYNLRVSETRVIDDSGEIVGRFTRTVNNTTSFEDNGEVFDNLKRGSSYRVEVDVRNMNDLLPRREDRKGVPSDVDIPLSFGTSQTLNPEIGGAGWSLNSSTGGLGAGDTTTVNFSFTVPVDYEGVVDRDKMNMRAHIGRGNQYTAVESLDNPLGKWDYLQDDNYSFLSFEVEDASPNLRPLLLEVYDLDNNLLGKATRDRDRFEVYNGDTLVAEFGSHDLAIRKANEISGSVIKFNDREVWKQDVDSREFSVYQGNVSLGSFTDIDRAIGRGMRFANSHIEYGGEVLWERERDGLIFEIYQGSQKLGDGDIGGNSEVDTYYNFARPYQIAQLFANSEIRLNGESVWSRNDTYHQEHTVYQGSVNLGSFSNAEKAYEEALKWNNSIIKHTGTGDTIWRFGESAPTISGTSNQTVFYVSQHGHGLGSFSSFHVAQREATKWANSIITTESYSGDVIWRRSDAQLLTVRTSGGNVVNGGRMNDLEEAIHLARQLSNSTIEFTNPRTNESTTIWRDGEDRNTYHAFQNNTRLGGTFLSLDDAIREAKKFDHSRVEHRGEVIWTFEGIDIELEEGAYVEAGETYILRGEAANLGADYEVDSRISTIPANSRRVVTYMTSRDFRDNGVGTTTNTGTPLSAGSSFSYEKEVTIPSDYGSNDSDVRNSETGELEFTFRTEVDKNKELHNTGFNSDTSDDFLRITFPVVEEERNNLALDFDGFYRGDELIGTETFEVGGSSIEVDDLGTNELVVARYTMELELADRFETPSFNPNEDNNRPPSRVKLEDNGGIRLNVTNSIFGSRGTSEEQSTTVQAIAIYDRRGNRRSSINEMEHGDVAVFEIPLQSGDLPILETEAEILPNYLSQIRDTIESDNSVETQRAEGMNNLRVTDFSVSPSTFERVEGGHNFVPIELSYYLENQSTGVSGSEIETADIEYTVRDENNNLLYQEVETNVSMRSRARDIDFGVFNVEGINTLRFEVNINHNENEVEHIHLDSPFADNPYFDNIGRDTMRIEELIPSGDECITRNTRNIWNINFTRQYRERYSYRVTNCSGFGENRSCWTSTRYANRASSPDIYTARFEEEHNIQKVEFRSRHTQERFGGFVDITNDDSEAIIGAGEGFELRVTIDYETDVRQEFQRLRQFGQPLGAQPAITGNRTGRWRTGVISPNPYGTPKEILARTGVNIYSDELRTPTDGSLRRGLERTDITGNWDEQEMVFEFEESTFIEAVGDERKQYTYDKLQDGEYQVKIDTSRFNGYEDTNDMLCDIFTFTIEVDGVFGDNSSHIVQ